MGDDSLDWFFSPYQPGVFTSGTDPNTGESYGTNPNSGSDSTVVYKYGDLPAAVTGGADPSKWDPSQLYRFITTGSPDVSTGTGGFNFGQLGNALKTFFDPKGGAGALPLAGLAALMNQSNFFNPPPEKVGFQGTIPEMTATRTQTPAAQQRPPGYEPGQGGITYFNPTQYTPKAAGGGEMHGGISELAQGRFLRGGGDGVSDSIPAQFAGSGKPARLADGEFVVPARVVSELGNGSSEAGARKLYAMLDRVERAGKKAKRGGDSHADKHLPA